MARMWHGYGGPTETSPPCCGHVVVKLGHDRFRVRELRQAPMLLYLGTDMLRVVRTRPLVPVAVSGDRYSASYSVAPWVTPPAGTRHLIRLPPRLCRGTRRAPGTL
jgi:hypothetical protein